MRTETSFEFQGAERLHLALSAGAVVTSYALVSPVFALSLAAGAALETLNFRHLLRSSRRLFVAGASWNSGFALRFAFLALGIAGALYLGAHPVGLLAGLSLIVPAVVVTAWRNRPAVDPDASALDPDDPSWELWDPWLARERAELEDER